MTIELREKASYAIELSKGSLTIEYAKASIEQEKKTIAYWENHSSMYEAKILINRANGMIEYYEAVIKILAEMAEKAA